jgi:hypothetical protein
MEPRILSPRCGRVALGFARIERTVAVPFEHRQSQTAELPLVGAPLIQNNRRARRDGQRRPAGSAAQGRVVLLTNTRGVKKR